VLERERLGLRGQLGRLIQRLDQGFDFDELLVVGRDDKLIGSGVVPAGRYGLWSYFWSDEAMMSGMQAGEKALKSITSDDAQEAAIAAG